MITAEQFSKAKMFIYRYGDLLTRKRFAFHFEEGSKQAILDVLSCYQNPDGGFGNGLELDVMCPASSGICTEVALGYLVELNVSEGPLFEKALQWVVSSKCDNGDLPHPVDAVKQYPHGDWWKDDGLRIMSVAGLLGKLGKCPQEISERAAAVFENSHNPFPKELGVYSYPAALYLRYGDIAGTHRSFINQLDAAFPAMLQKDAWHHPLFFCHDRWSHFDIPESTWQSEAKRVIATLQDDGGVMIEQYKQFPWWRPIWTLDMLLILKKHGLLEKAE